MQLPACGGMCVSTGGVIAICAEEECVCPGVQRDLAAELEELEQGATELDAQVPSRKMLMDGYSVQEASCALPPPPPTWPQPWALPPVHMFHVDSLRQGGSA